MNNTFKYIDTHVHLYDEAFDCDFGETLQRIKDAGVGYCIFPAIDRENYERQTECAKKCGGFAFEAIGLHPTSVGANWKEELDFVKERLEAGKGTYVAVGEIFSRAGYRKGKCMVCVVAFFHTKTVTFFAAHTVTCPARCTVRRLCADFKAFVILGYMHHILCIHIS